MTKTQERRFNMVDAMITYCDAHPDIVATNKPFQKYLLQVKRQYSSIGAAAAGQDEDSTGIKREKTLARTRLCLEASVVCGQTAAWATDREKPELQERNNWTQSTLSLLTDARLERACRAIVADGRATLAADPDCGLTEAGLMHLESLIGTFSELKEAPRNKTSDRSTHTKNMSTLMKGLTELLREKLDKSALTFKKTNPDFYTGYKENRKIMDVASRSAAEGHGGGNG